MPSKDRFSLFQFASADIGGENGAPGKSRTCDLLVRSQTLYPAELRAPRNANAVQIDYDTRAETSTISPRIFPQLQTFRAIKVLVTAGLRYAKQQRYRGAKRDDDRTTTPTES